MDRMGGCCRCSCRPPPLRRLGPTRRCRCLTSPGGTRDPAGILAPSCSGTARAASASARRRRRSPLRVVRRRRPRRWTSDCAAAVAGERWSGVFPSSMWQDGRPLGWRRGGATETIGEWWSGERVLGTGRRRQSHRWTSRAAVAAWEWSGALFLARGARRTAAAVDGAGPQSELWMMGTGWDRRPLGLIREEASAAIASVEARRPRERARGTPRPSASLVCCAVPGASGLGWWCE